MDFWLLPATSLLPREFHPVAYLLRPLLRGSTSWTVELQRKSQDRGAEIDDYSGLEIVDSLHTLVFWFNFAVSNKFLPFQTSCEVLPFVPPRSYSARVFDSSPRNFGLVDRNVGVPTSSSYPCEKRPFEILWVDL